MALAEHAPTAANGVQIKCLPILLIRLPNGNHRDSTKSKAPFPVLMEGLASLFQMCFVIYGILRFIWSDQL